MIDLSGKHIFVAGGSRGIGAASARMAAAAGAKVSLSYNSSPDAAAKLVEEIQLAGGHAQAFQAEVSDEQTRLMLRAVQEVEQVAEDAAAVGLEIHVDDEEALKSILNRLDLVSTEARRRRGEGPVRLKLPVYDHDQEVTVDLPGQYAISAEIRGALKSVPGVHAVSEF